MAEAIADKVRALGCGHGYTIRRTAPWIVASPGGAAQPEHGWKLHVSSRAATFEPLVTKLVPALVTEGCVFKLAESPDALKKLNDGLYAPTSVGKAFTIYPEPGRVRQLGLALVELLRGYHVPRVLSDRRIAVSAPVFYRYGPFSTQLRSDHSGRQSLIMRGPNGEEFDGEASHSYREPPWATDPFQGKNVQPPDNGLLLCNKRYLVTEGLYQSGRGNVYRGIDRTSGDSVIIKQARAWVDETNNDLDTRMRIRNERRILQASAGVSGIPRFIDHFRHAADEFLVTSDQGSINLRDEVQENGPFRLDARDSRSLPELARKLAAIIDNLHRRQIIMRDITPRNIVLRKASQIQVSIIDFGIAASGGVFVPGGTPTFAPARQMAGESPSPADDLYALGMTLFEALTGLIPFFDDDATLMRKKTLETLRQSWGETPPPFIGAVADLTHPDAVVATAAFHRIRLGSYEYQSIFTLPKPVVINDKLATLIVDNLLEDVLDTIDSVLSIPEGGIRTNLTLHSGLAGAGLELLHHDSSANVLGLLDRIIAHVRTGVDNTDLGPGLFAGRTGVDIFLQEAMTRVGRGTFAHQRPDISKLPDESDIMFGAAGVGIGHLWRYEKKGDPRDLDVVFRCLDALAERSFEEVAFAHGLAGVVEFETRSIEYVDPWVSDAHLTDLLLHAERLKMEAISHTGNTLKTISWCNGLAGITRVLFHAGQRMERPDCIQAALDAGDALAGWIPRSSDIGQCCGVAGIGDLFIDLSKVEGGSRFTDHAWDVGRHILLRSGGTADHPRWSAMADPRERASWAVGLPGILGFFRRLRDSGGQRMLPGI